MLGTVAQDHPTQERGSRSRNSRSSNSKRKMQEPTDRATAGADLRALRRGEEKGSVIGASGQASGQVRAKRRFKVSGTMFEVDTKYELIKPIGHGAYGVVISALDTENGQKVAIKKITRAFDDLIDAKRILREITLLRKFSHDNIISIVDILVPPSPEEFEDVYIVSDLMETDLHRIINSKQELTPDHVQYFLYQILRALKYMHSSNVLHRDLKPSNLLLNSNCDLKVCDLGLARDIESGCRELTEYVVTRWYRAPEIMLACQEYSKAIDMWSVGCIFAELMLRRPFFPGDNYIDQLTIICDKLGKPKEEELTFVSTEKARRFIMKLSETTPRCLRDQFPSTASDDALDLLSKMLEFSPDSRISVEDALRHPFMQNLHAAKEEPVADFEFCFAFEAEEPSKHRMQELMWEEMRRYHPEQGVWRGKKAPAAAEQATGSQRALSLVGEETNSVAPLGRSPIKTERGVVDTPSVGGASAAAVSKAGGERDSVPPVPPADEESFEESSGQAPARGSAQPGIPSRRTSSRVAAAAAAGGKGRTHDASVDPGVTTLPVDSAPTSAPNRPGDGFLLAQQSSSSHHTGSSGSSSGDAEAPRAKTRATARARVIKGRTTACPAEKARLPASRCAPPPASAVAAPIAAAKATAANKRQRRGGLLTTFIKPAEKGGGSSSISGRDCRQGAPADGTSEFLTKQNKQTKFGLEPLSESPELLGK
eukprot:g8832.t1